MDAHCCSINIHSGFSLPVTVPLTRVWCHLPAHPSAHRLPPPPHPLPPTLPSNLRAFSRSFDSNYKGKQKQKTRAQQNNNLSLEFHSPDGEQPIDKIIPTLSTRSHAASAGKDKDNGDGNKRPRADSADAGTGSSTRGRRGGVRQRERDERKRDRADSRDRESSTSGRDPKRNSGGKTERGSTRDSFAGGAGGPPFRDLENWEPEKVRVRLLVFRYFVFNFGVYFWTNTNVVGQGRWPYMLYRRHFQLYYDTRGCFERCLARSTFLFSHVGRQATLEHVFMSFFSCTCLAIAPTCLYM